MTSVILVIIACKNIHEAKKIAKHLLDQRFVACTNIIRNVDSLYLWPPKTGVIAKSSECLILCKTLESKWHAVEQAVINLHSYDTPSIEAVPLIHVSKTYQKWLASEIS